MATESQPTYGPRAQQILGGTAVSEALPAERIAFIRKVYSLFFVSLLCAVAAGWWVVTNGHWVWFLQHPFLAIGVYIGGVLLVYAFKKTPGLNAVLLFAFAAFTGAYFSIPVIGSYLATGGELVQKGGRLALTGGNFDIAAQAGGLTLSLFGGLTLFAFVSRKDFSFLGGALTMGLFLLLGVVIINLFVGFSDTTVLLYSVGAVILFGGYVLYDTSNIIRRYPKDMATAAALDIYIDVLILFLYILRILMILNRR